MLRGVVDKGKLGRGWMKMGKGRETRWRKRDKERNRKGLKLVFKRIHLY